MRKYSGLFAPLLSLLALALLAGCAAKSDVEALQEENRRSRQESRELYRQLEEELSRKIETTSTPVQARQADIWAELNLLRQDMADLSGRMDDLDLRLGALAGEGNSTASLPQVARDVEAIKFALEHQLAVDMAEVMRLADAARPAPQLTGMEGMVEAAPEVPGAAAPTAESGQAEEPAARATEETAPEPVQADADPAQVLYDRAYDLFGQRKYDAARSLWAEFTTTFKDHPLVPNAIFWQGECWYQMQDYQRAILAYQDVIKQHPKSSKYRYALLKQGISFHRLGKSDLGNLVLEDLVSKFPDSTEATRAKQFMKDNQ